MSTPIYPESVATTSDIVIKYVNHLLRVHAMDQSLLANQPIDEKLRRQRDDVREKNTHLEMENRRLRMELQRAQELAAQLINERNLNSLGPHTSTIQVVGEDDPDHKTFRKAPK